MIAGSNFWHNTTERDVRGLTLNDVCKDPDADGWDALPCVLLIELGLDDCDRGFIARCFNSQQGLCGHLNSQSRQPLFGCFALFAIREQPHTFAVERLCGSELLQIHTAVTRKQECPRFSLKVRVLLNDFDKIYSGAVVVLKLKIDAGFQATPVSFAP